MIHYRWYVSGELFAMRYEMGLDDALPLHKHDRTTVHNVVVLEGLAELKMLGTTRLMMAGDVVDFDGFIEHRIVSLASRTVLLNFFLNGMPEAYRTLPPSEHSGVFQP